MMNTLHQYPARGLRSRTQRGLVLFFALIALLVLSLAAVALVRSVDTSTIIAGNLAFKKSATSSGDIGVETAMSWLTATQAANNTINVLEDGTHAFNQDAPVLGYYSSVHDDPADPSYINVFSDAAWTNAGSVLVGGGADPATGNSTRYIIQRLCRTANQPMKTAGCLYSGAMQDNNGQNIKLPQEVCKGAGCPVAGQTAMLRITTRITGPKNTVSYVQAFVY